MKRTKAQIMIYVSSFVSLISSKNKYSSGLLNLGSAPSVDCVAAGCLADRRVENRAVRLFRLIWRTVLKPLNASSYKIFIFISQARESSRCFWPSAPTPVLWQSRQLFEIRHQIVLLKPLAGVMLIAP